LKIAVANTETYFCKTKVIISHDTKTNAGLLYDKYGAVFFNPEGAQRATNMDMLKSGSYDEIVRIYSRNKASLSGGPESPERFFSSISNDGQRFFVRDPGKGAMKSIIYMEDGNRPRLTKYWIGLRSLDTKYYECVRTN